jgi:hypothetical protein
MTPSVESTRLLFPGNTQTRNLHLRFTGKFWFARAGFVEQTWDLATVAHPGKVNDGSDERLPPTRSRSPNNATKQEGPYRRFASVNCRSVKGLFYDG